MSRVDKGCARTAYETRQRTGLSEFELATVRMLAQGMLIKAIAHERGVSPRTVEHQLSAARKKSGSKTLPQLTVWAERQGLLRDQSEEVTP